MNSILSRHPNGTRAGNSGASATWSDPGLGLLAFTGADAEAFLQGQFSNDVAALVPGTIQLSSYNSPKGRMLANLVLWRVDADSFRALVPADLAEPLRKRLAMYVLRAKVVVADVSATTALVGIAGPHALDAVLATFGEAPPPGHVVAKDSEALVGLPDGRIVAVTARTMMKARIESLADHATAAPPEYWRWLGIRAGVPTIHPATQDLFVPQTANWDLLGGVNFQKGCYPGQEIVARTQYLGRLKERLQIFHGEFPSPEPGTKMYGELFGNQSCGTVVDAAAAPGGGTDLLAVVQLAALSGRIRLGATDGPAMESLPLPYVIPAPVAPNRPKL
jgi:tRNA-modifying protein YgfZ